MKIRKFCTLFNRVPLPDDLKPVFDQRIEQIGAQTAPIVSLLSAVLVSGSYVFDLIFIDPRLHRTFLFVRLACMVLAIVIFLISRTTTGRRNGIALSYIMLLIIGLSSSILIHLVGYDHSYYAMLNVIYLGAMIVPMTWKLCLSACLTIFMFYLTPIFIFPKEAVDLGILANNIGFQLETIIVSVLYSYFFTRKRVLQIINEQLIINQRDQISHNLSKINELQESRQQFIQNITHDLKTPLSIIAGYIDLVSAKHDAPEESAKSFRFMADAVDQSARLLDQLTSIAMLDAGNLPADMKLFDYSGFIQTFCGRFTVLAEQYKVSFDVSVPEERLAVTMDLSWMERILGNLVQNAFKHTPEGGTISVRLLRDKEVAITEVHDTGSGIAEEKLPFIFERKYQAGEEDRKVGYGLGLNIVQNMLERMDGAIQVRSSPGKGSIFTFTIPLQPESGASLLHEPYPESRFTDTPNDFGTATPDRMAGGRVSDAVIANLRLENRTGRPTILICEDSPGQLSLLVEALRKDFNLLVARNGEEGLAVISRQREAIDLILSDVRMPVMDGIEFCKRFFADKSRLFTPFILLTAFANEHEHVAGLASGATDYLQKPFNQRILNEKINHWLLRRHHERLLVQMVDDLEEKNEMISRFRSIITHEIRNPLAALYGMQHYLDTLHNELFETFNLKQKKYFTSIEKTVGIASQINEILDTMKLLEQSTTEFSCKAEPVATILSDIMEQTGYFSGYQKISLSDTVSAETMVLCNLTMIRQIMVNLLRNAVEAVHETGKPGDVSLKAESDDTFLTLSVVDTGPGMTDEQKKNLFKYRATTKKDGNGIGLYLSMKLLQLQNGQMQCESIAGCGTTFTVKLPLVG